MWYPCLQRIATITHSEQAYKRETSRVSHCEHTPVEGDERNVEELELIEVLATMRDVLALPDPEVLRQSGEMSVRCLHAYQSCAQHAANVPQR